MGFKSFLLFASAKVELFYFVDKTSWTGYCALRPLGRKTLGYQGKRRNGEEIKGRVATDWHLLSQGFLSVRRSNNRD